MAEPKPLASLSGSLLARKGAAKPAMRRQGVGGLTSITSHHDDLGWDDMGYDVDPSQNDEQAEHQRIDLTPMLTPLHQAREATGADGDEEHYPVPEVVRQRETLARNFEATETEDAAAAPEAASAAPAKAMVDLSSPAVAMPQAEPAPAVTLKGRKPRAKTSSKGKAAFTLRIDPERHLRLRLASALTRRSAQVILTDALDKYLKTLPEVDALAHQLPNS